MYLKRNKIPKTWPLPRKGTKYLVRPSHNQKNSLPLLIILRDLLKVVKTKKEAKQILNLGKIKINGKIIRSLNYSLALFDNLSFEDKHFKLILENKKFNIEQCKEQIMKKIAKVIDKKIQKKGIVQVNLGDGRNYLIKEKVKTGDSVIIDLKENKITKILPLEKGCKVLFVKGKHLGSEGKIEEIDEKSKLISVKVEGEKINSRLSSLMVIE